MTRDDLRAAVASGVIDEAQAVSLQAQSDQRMGYRANMIGDDGPFALFKGFAEILLTAGLIYMGLLIAQAIGDTGTKWAPVIATLVLGLFVIALGAFWTQVRTAIMGALPDFPGKERLPPYAAGLSVSD